MLITVTINDSALLKLILLKCMLLFSVIQNILLLRGMYIFCCK